ncbi:MAG: transposase [Oscillatoriaceae cyanobacterium Prado104]|jgi:hypothetical protein|nr:transposase [Oscillatoriaceae cyanobacterium Prado104]
MIDRWVRQELEKTQLGDVRRTNRFMKIVSNLSNNPESSVPKASGTWAETKATYDFWDSPYIKPAQLRQGIEWWLITNLPITCIADVTTYVRWYSYRWLIERYHYVLKSGCGIEKLQIDRPDIYYISSYFCQIFG